MSGPKPAELTKTIIAEIKWLYLYEGWEQQALAWEYRQNQRLINHIVHGKRFPEIDPHPPLKAVA